MADRHFVAAEQRDRERRRHAVGAAASHPGVVDREVGGVEHPPQQLVVGRRRIGLAKDAQRRLDGKAAGNLAVAMTTDAIGQQRDGAEGLPGVFRL